MLIPFFSGRPQLSAATTIFVATTGSDTANTGLTSGSPYLTIQKALNVAATYDTNGFAITIQLADGTYTAGGTFPTIVGSGSITVQGNTSAINNVLINVAAGTGFLVSNVTGQFSVQWLKITCNIGVRASQGSAITVTNVTFGTCGAYHMFADFRGFINCGAGIHLAGNCIASVIANDQGSIAIGLQTFTLDANITVTYFCDSERNAYVYAASWTITLGAFAVTGQRYNVATGGGILTGGGGSSYFPGTTSGVATTPGWTA